MPNSRTNFYSWEKNNIRWSGYFGCITQVRPSAEAPPLDLDKADKLFNVEPGCMRDEEVSLHSLIM
jgi:hypothetical protein